MNISKQKRIRISLWFCMVFVCSIAIVAGIFVLQNSQRTPHWDDLNIPRLYLGETNANFSVKNGKIYKNEKEISKIFDRKEHDRVLGLALFYQWVKEDPLMFSATLEDVDELKSVLERLEKDDKIIFENLAKVTSQASTPDIYLQQKAPDQLHPIVFLRKYIEASTQFQVFSQDISEENAELLLSKMTDADKSYVDDIQAIMRGYKQVSSDTDTQRILFLGGETSTNRAIILDDFKKIEDNGKLVETEIQKRSDCLHGDPRFCVRPMESFNAPNSVVILPNEHSEILKKEELWVDDADQLRGPYNVRSSCWDKKNSSYLYYGDKCTETEGEYGCFEQVYLADDMYFIPPSNLTVSGNKLIEQQVKLVPTNATGQYDCIDLEYKQMLATTDYFFEKFKDNLLFEKVASENKDNGNYALNKIIDAGLQAEHDFFNVKYPSDGALEKLGQYYAHMCKFSSEKNLFDSQTRDEFLERHLIISEKTSQFKATIGRIMKNLEVFNRNVSQTKNIAPLRYHYVTRSNYALFFLNFSPTVWRNSQKLQYMAKDGEVVRNENVSRFVHLKQALEEYGADQLREWAKMSQDLKNQNIPSI